jgi:uncharacterized phage protein (TIGR01671 family)
MKREIKFRGKCLHTGEWHYGDCVQHSDNTVFIRERGTASSLSNPETIGQFTGLHDKNGKEIYEGDIMHIKQYKNNGYRMFGADINFPNCFTLDECKGELLREGNALVYFTEGCMCVGDMYISALFGDMRYSLPIFEFEVIGNIHDNPELLKTETL